MFTEEDGNHMLEAGLPSCQLLIIVKNHNMSRVLGALVVKSFEIRSRFLLRDDGIHLRQSE